MLKSPRYHYYPLFSSIRGKLSCKKSALVGFEILRLLVTTLTANDKYYRSNMQNLEQQYRTSLSRKQKTISGIFFAFLKCAWYLGHFQKRDEYPRLIISEIIEAERRGYLKV